MKIRLILFFLALMTWMSLVWSVTAEDIFVGLLVSIFISFFTKDLFNNSLGPFKSPRTIFWFIYFVFLFSWECIKANFDGAYRVIHPDLPINPGIVKVKTQLKSDAALTFLANSLTLKPGTMTVDIDKEKGFLYVHWVDVKSQDVEKATQMVVSKFEGVLTRIFQ